MRVISYAVSIRPGRRPEPKVERCNLSPWGTPLPGPLSLYSERTGPICAEERPRKVWAASQTPGAGRRPGSGAMPCPLAPPSPISESRYSVPFSLRPKRAGAARAERRMVTPSATEFVFVVGAGGRAAPRIRCCALSSALSLYAFWYTLKVPFRPDPAWRALQLFRNELWLLWQHQKKYASRKRQGLGGSRDQRVCPVLWPPPPRAPGDTRQRIAPSPLP